MLVWLASYPRSGNTLLRQVLKRCFDLTSCEGLEPVPAAFRAPDMFYLFSSHSSGYSQSTDYYKCRQEGYNSQNYGDCAQSGTSMLAVSPPHRNAPAIFRSARN